jgi:pyridoxal/pyridoxine/pyridoxamine kinase
VGIQKFDRSKWIDVCAAVSIGMLGKRAEIEVISRWLDAYQGDAPPSRIMDRADSGGLRMVRAESQLHCTP